MKQNITVCYADGKIWSIFIQIEAATIIKCVYVCTCMFTCMTVYVSVMVGIRI